MQDENNLIQAKKALTSMIGTFIGAQQASVVADILRSEERYEMAQRINEIWKRIQEMPQTYETQSLSSEEKVCELHYMLGSFDAWIVEKDMGMGQQWTPVTPQQQAYGLIDLGDAEIGYVSIAELLQNGFELDLHWAPKSLSSVYRQARQRGY